MNSAAKIAPNMAVVLVEAFEFDLEVRRQMAIYQEAEGAEKLHEILKIYIWT